jgi:hypothetical protein
MQPRDAVWVHFGGKKRPGFVVSVDGDKCLVIAGTGTPRPHYPSISIDSFTREGKAQRFEKITYFYPSNVELFLNSQVEIRNAAKCPHSIFEGILGLIKESI